MYALVIDTKIRTSITSLIESKAEITQFVVKKNEEDYEMWLDYLEDKINPVDVETLETMLDELEEELSVYIERPIEVDELGNKDIQVTIEYHRVDLEDSVENDLDDDEVEEEYPVPTLEYEDLDDKLIPESRDE